MLKQFYKQFKKPFKSLLAFTMLEVLVALSIFIIIIGAVAVPHVDKMFLKVKSTQRVHDIKTIQTALNFYKQENGFYPNQVVFGEPLVGVNGKTYLTKVPVSFQDAVCATPFVYAITSNGISYNLDFCVSAKLDKVDVGLCVAVPGNLCCRRVCDATKVCGDDGCGKSCGTCDNGLTCSNNACVSCIGSCDGRECGSDGCTGSCGSPCSDSKICAAGKCKSYNTDTVSRVVVDNNFSVRSVKMSQDGSIIYAVPHLAKTIMKSEDAGSTWTLVTSSLFISNFPFNSLETNGNGQKIALVDSQKYFFLSLDGGISWARKDFFKNGGYYCYNLKADYDFNYLGCNSTGNYLAQSVNTGSNWTFSGESIQAFDV
ncbi:hypothetical protein COT94_02885 [Candidatus Falkowbacteria bacterium CG10_big_fil_rev_8_21_14_0_10_37_14]|uniref:Photosynthesis system II assembly factor Ycf48/Hcf136-like domain-containing protein n=1 Tax=Candidatus Falkowbacteria bacterium CG10_big_fil_rev_8_21_14_0_10_37_14 TaxID=1974561 RepID=A0A2M6WT54_9BACT|nr:MAG: hypothetical protein COT94_02885 [Candidatus Falkowbacteria bacterium CG10_big_fil_rev_8_21_14_0_10_37_14]